MKTPDLDRIRSEELRTLKGFCDEYNTGLPESFTPVTVELLAEYRKSHADAFRTKGKWSLDQHRKKIMDWLPMHVQSKNS